MVGTLANIKQQLVDMQDREFEAVQKVKIGLEISEQASVEKTQVC